MQAETETVFTDTPDERTLETHSQSTVVSTGSRSVESEMATGIYQPAPSTNVAEKTPPDDDVTAEMPSGGDVSRGWSSFLSPVEPSTAKIKLEPGAVLAGRYEIQKVLGEGGMGFVYKAHDNEVDRLVAIKVIRPELARDPQILQRFKQELILAREVTHRNVVRIFDLGVAQGIKFISMEFIEGRELTDLIEESGKLDPKLAAEIMAQVCSGLDAAHSVGVIHRDLKPANIMIDTQGRAAVMDFGIAYSMGLGADAAASSTKMAKTTPATGIAPSPSGNQALTRVGAYLGTPRYMSPEQAKREQVDARSDIFTVGIILYELLTGQRPFQASSAKESLRLRIEETAAPPNVLNPAIPKTLNKIVVKCLERDLEKRYPSAGSLVHDLEVFLGVRQGLRTAQVQRMRYMASGLAALLTIAAGFIAWNQYNAPVKAHPPVKLLIADFTNKTGETVLDGTLEPILQVALEQASFINSYNRGAAKKIATELKPGQNQMDESAARLVALREGVGIVVSGTIEKSGSGYKLAAKAIDPAKGETVVERAEDARQTRDLPQAVNKLAARIRSALGDKSSSKGEAEETFTSASLDAAQHYAQAQELQWAGKWNESSELYKKAIGLDPNLSRAYSGLAATLANLGRRQEAESYYQQALARADRMSDREKYRTRGGYYLMERDYQKAAEQYKFLVTQYPADTSAISNLAVSNFYSRNMTAALQDGQRAVDIYPNNLLFRNNVSLYALYAGDFDRAIRESNTIVKQNPSFEKVYLGLGLAHLAKGEDVEALASYDRMAKLGEWGASKAALAYGDAALYHGDYAKAVSLLTKGIEEDLKHKTQGEAAIKSIALATGSIERGRKGEALQSANQAMGWSDDLAILYPAARVYIETAEWSKVAGIVEKLSSQFGPEPRAMAKLIEGEVLLKAGKFREAVETFQSAQKLADSWLGRFALGRGYLAAGIFPDADSEFDVCLKRRGEATSIYLDDDPTMRYFPVVYYYQGLARAGLKSAGANESFKTFLSLQRNAEGNPLVNDAKRRLQIPNTSKAP